MEQLGVGLDPMIARSNYVVISVSSSTIPHCFIFLTLSFFFAFMFSTYLE